MKIAILGRGNVASHLNNALKDKNETIMVNSHTPELIPQDVDIVLICVSDNAIQEVFEKLPLINGIVAHTSGSTPMEVLKGKERDFGVFYPLQTFTKGVELDYKEIPVFIEGSNDRAKQKLIELAKTFSNDVREANSAERRELHLASVFACNFLNALARISKELLDKKNIDFSVLLPLMKQTVKKLESLTPREAQTGPAVRNDSKVITTHMNMLEDNPQLKTLYKLFTDLIQNEKI